MILAHSLLFYLCCTGLHGVGGEHTDQEDAGHPHRPYLIKILRGLLTSTVKNDKDDSKRANGKLCILLIFESI